MKKKQLTLDVRRTPQKRYKHNLAILRDETKWQCMEAKMRDKNGSHLGTLIMKAYNAKASHAL